MPLTLKKPRPVFTIGHSVLKLADFISLLKSYKIKRVADIRTVPKSRHNPQFNKTNLQIKLPSQKITYLHLPSLGGFRHPLKNSKNSGWHNASFRGFADYMQTCEFKAALKDLIDISAKKQLVLMCAESLPWRCHRSLIADALTAKGIKVKHIFNKKNCKEHVLTKWIKVKGDKITYPG